MGTAYFWVEALKWGCFIVKLQLLPESWATEWCDELRSCSHSLSQPLQSERAGHRKIAPGMVAYTEIPVLRRVMRQGDYYEFKASLSYMRQFCLMGKKIAVCGEPAL